MPSNVAELEAQALELSSEERDELADRLQGSLYGNPGIEAAWDVEIERRIAAVDRGEVKGLDGEEVLTQARRLARG